MIIYSDNGNIEELNIVSESASLQESICSESSLRFGLCEASVFKVRLCDIDMPIVDTVITVTNGTYTYGLYKVNSDKPTADRKYRDIVAYDFMYDIINAEVSEWYNTLLPTEDSSVTLKQMRTSFFDYMGIQQETVDLPNDSMAVFKTVEPSSLSGKTVITAICEINGCFGHINRSGVFSYVFLRENNIAELDTSQYISAQYEDFITEKITKLQIRQEEGDIGVIYGSGANCYIVQDNFLLYGKSSNELQSVAANLYDVISQVAYRPASIELKGNLELSVGDAIKVTTTNGTEIQTYILQRTLEGIKALRDTYAAEGEQYQAEEVNSIHNDIIQLKGKANVLKRTIEETQLTISDVEKGLQTQITQNAESISTEVTRATKAEGDLSSRITQTANSFSVEINNLQNQIDGNIMTYNLNYVPTLTNYPAWDWTYNIPCNNTVQLSDTLQFEYKDEYWRRNARSVAFNTETFISYRFLEKNGLWGWIEVADSEYSYVLQRVSELEMSDETITASVKQLEQEIIADYMTKKDAQSLVTQTATEIRTEVSNTYETKTNASSQYSKLNSSITQTAKSIRSEVSETYETKTNASSQYGKLSSSITQTAKEITAEVKRATAAEGTLSSRITQNANGISTKVSKGSVSSEISQEAGKIAIKSDRLSIESTYFGLSEDGTIRATAGKIANLSVKDYHLYWDYGDTSAGMSALSHGSAFWAGASFANKDNAPFRVWHDGTVICKKLEAAQYTKTSDLEAVVARFGYASIDDLEAVDAKFSGYVTMNSFNAVSGRVADLEADAITADTLESSIANIRTTRVQNITSSGIANFSWIQYGDYHFVVRYSSTLDGYVVMAEDESSTLSLLSED